MKTSEKVTLGYFKTEARLRVLGKEREGEKRRKRKSGGAEEQLFSNMS